MKYYFLEVADNGETNLRMMDNQFVITSAFELKHMSITSQEMALEDALDCISNDLSDTQNQLVDSRNELKQVAKNLHCPVTEDGWEFRYQHLNEKVEIVNKKESVFGGLFKPVDWVKVRHDFRQFFSGFEPKKYVPKNEVSARPKSNAVVLSDEEFKELLGKDLIAVVDDIIEADEVKDEVVT